MVETNSREGCSQGLTFARFSLHVSGAVTANAAGYHTPYIYGHTSGHIFILTRRDKRSVISLGTTYTIPRLDRITSGLLALFGYRQSFFLTIPLSLGHSNKL
jgi:hypothetical protein